MRVSVAVVCACETFLGEIQLKTNTTKKEEKEETGGGGGGGEEEEKGL